MRPRLKGLGLCTALEVRALGHGAAVHTGGLVINRQRPGTATGGVFATLEDETGYSNLILRSALLEREHRVPLGARLLGVHGRIQREGEVVHGLAEHLEDHSPPLGRLVTGSRDFH